MGCRQSRYSVDAVDGFGEAGVGEEYFQYATQLEYDLGFVSPHHASRSTALDASAGLPFDSPPKLRTHLSPHHNLASPADGGLHSGAGLLLTDGTAARTPHGLITPALQQRQDMGTPLVSSEAWASSMAWMAEQARAVLDWLREWWQWLVRCESKQRTIACAVICALVLLVGVSSLMLMQRSQMWAFLPGRGGVTLFYKLLMCPPATTSIGGRHFTYETAKVGDMCHEWVAGGEESAMHRAQSLDIILRLDDGYRAGDAYLPVILLGQGHYALITISAIDALRRPVYTHVTLQLGPDERYPWSMNHTVAATTPEEEDVVEDLVEDLGEDLFEDIVQATSDRIELLFEDTSDLVENLAEDLFDSIDGRNATQDRAEEVAEVAEEKSEEHAEHAAERAEIVAEEHAEEEEEEFEAAEEQGLLVGAEKRSGYYRFKQTLFGRAALCALRVDDDCDYFLHERMSSAVSVPEVYYNEATPPYFAGSHAVPAGSPILVATSEHYSVRSNYLVRNGCRGSRCDNVSVYRPPGDFDRYELVPAAALQTPMEKIRWPLQLRVQSAVIYKEVKSAGAVPEAMAPNLITFQGLGFEPEFTAYSAPGLAADHVSVYKRATPAGVAALIFVVVSLPLVLLCARAARAVIEFGGSPARRGGEDWVEDFSPAASPSPSSASPSPPITRMRSSPEPGSRAIVTMRPPAAAELL